MGDSVGSELAYSGLQERVLQVQFLRLAGFKRLRGATDDVLTTIHHEVKVKGQGDLGFMALPLSVSEWVSMERHWSLQLIACILDFQT